MSQNLGTRCTYGFLAMLLFLCCSSTALADRIVLKGGDVIDGTVIRKTEREVTLRNRLGIISFNLDRVSTVRENGQTLTVDQIRTELRGEPDARSAPPAISSVEPNGAQGEYAELRQKLERTLAELEATPLASWAVRQKEVAAQPRGRYRVLVPDESEYREVDELPDNPGLLREVWMLERRNGGLTRPDPDSSSTAWWVPLYWHSRGQRWLHNHPNESAFNWEDAQVRKALRRVALTAGTSRASHVEHVLEELRTEVDPARQARWRRALKGATRSIAGAWNGDQLLYEIHLATVDIADAPPPEKVALARRRRELLKQLFAMLP